MNHPRAKSTRSRRDRNVPALARGGTHKKVDEADAHWLAFTEADGDTSTEAAMFCKYTKAINVLFREAGQRRPIGAGNKASDSPHPFPTPFVCLPLASARSAMTSVGDKARRLERKPILPWGRG